jgi:hypothetical protein
MARPTPAEQLRRIERLPYPAYLRVMESDRGQALLEACRKAASAARKGVKA